MGLCGFSDVFNCWVLVSQHDLACPVKTDSSFWTLGNILSASDYCFCDSMQLCK
jgi:hypothetical protein